MSCISSFFYFYIWIKDYLDKDNKLNLRADYMSEKEIIVCEFIYDLNNGGEHFDLPQVK